MTGTMHALVTRHNNSELSLLLLGVLEFYAVKVKESKNSNNKMNEYSQYC